MQDRPWTSIGPDRPVLPGVEARPGSDDQAEVPGSAIRAWRVRPEAIALCWTARETLIELALDWDARPFLERQLLLREFRVRTGRPVSDWLTTLGRLERELIAGPGTHIEPAPLDRLAAFYDHIGDVDCERATELAWRDPELRHVDCRAAVVRRLADLLEPVSGTGSSVAWSARQATGPVSTERSDPRT